jgi:hypothetical protein
MPNQIRGYNYQKGNGIKNKWKTTIQTEIVFHIFLQVKKS